MSKLYANLIIKGEKTIDQVPKSKREEVIVILKEEGYLLMDDEV